MESLGGGGGAGSEVISVKMFGEEKCLVIKRGNYDCSFKKYCFIASEAANRVQ